MADLLTALGREVGERLPAYVETLRELVAIDSGSRDVEGVRRAGDRVAALLRDLGMSVERPVGESQGGSAAPAVVARAEGTGSLRVLLCGHLDTVFEPGTAARRPFRVDEAGRATGPGVSDDKGGLLAGVLALQALDAVGFRDYAVLTLVLVPDEEVGSPSSRALLAGLASSHDLALCLECAREDGSAVVGRKGVADAVLEVQGRSAHAGIEPDRGVSAAVAVAHLALDLHALNGEWPDVSVNVGVLQAGERPNVVAARGSVVADVRAESVESFDSVVSRIRWLAGRPGVPEASISLRLEAPAPPWQADGRSLAIAERARGVAGRLGIDLPLARTGGAADANLLAAHGLPVLDGLGPVGGNDHSADEWLDLTSVVPRATLLAGLVADLCEHPPPA